eukprot:s3351_g2.t1
MAQDTGQLAGLWQLLRETKQQALAPILLRNGVRSVSDVARLSCQLLEDGVAPWQVELLATVRSQDEPAPPQRWDLPVVRTVKRASLQAVLDAALPNNRRRCLESLERDVLAHSTRRAMDSKVKTYQTICAAWQVEPWPVSVQSIQCFGASLKEGAYKSAQGFFQAVFTYQRRHLQQDVDNVIRSAARDYSRSVSRGLGPSTLKDSFDVGLLTQIPIEAQAHPFSMQSPAHGRDVMLVASWFMMRELELAGCRWSHLWIENPNVNLMLPVQKNDTAGSLTMRSLRCACRVRLHPLCPVHAARRHMDRLRLHPEFRSQVEFPIVPTEEGKVASKHFMVQFFRMTISAAGINLTRPNQEGSETERFSGHVCRVSGAQWLSRLGMPLNQIQLLGRWSSIAVERYVQLAPLTQIERSGAALLHPGRSDDDVVNRGDVVDDDTGVAAQGHTQDRAIDVEALADTVEVEDSDQVPTEQQRVTQGDISYLRDQLVSLRQVVMEPPQTLIHRSKSHIVHVGSVNESSNNPVHWRTKCGWSYGLTSFFRLQSMQSGFRGCRRCFKDHEGQLASESDKSSGSSEDEGSSTSSE